LILPRTTDPERDGMTLNMSIISSEPPLLGSKNTQTKKQKVPGGVENFSRVLKL
jgi:hypothetical protein